MAVTLLVDKKICLGPVKRATCADFVAKRITFSLHSATTCIVADRVKGGQYNVQLILQQCCKVSLTLRWFAWVLEGIPPKFEH